jgi:hypothetical protein
MSVHVQYICEKQFYKKNKDKICNKLRKVHYWIKISNQYDMCSMKKNWMKIVLGSNTLLRNPTDALQRRGGFKIISTNCHKTPETETIEDNSSA